MRQFISDLAIEKLEVVKMNFKISMLEVRAPLVLLSWASGLISSMTTTFIKGVTELF